MGCLSTVTGTVLKLAVAAAGYQYLKTHNYRYTLPHGGIESVLSGAKPDAHRETTGAEHFAPAENLERLELAELRSAASVSRRANRSLDIAIYAFTDRAIAQLLAQEADRGTRIRIYRDGDQYENEQRNAQRFGEPSTTQMLRGHRNIEIRTKRPSRSDLMHLKAWSDGAVLREGSANWSPAAFKKQDNNVRYTGDPGEIRAFAKVFEEIWSRSSNTIAH